ncbi:MAG TPA: hypothetical protein VMV92_17530 [Streptosporangiaceae bacterium]|nr:hypothetical protein [Streptosporangiaceae bacterium]
MTQEGRRAPRTHRTRGTRADWCRFSVAGSTHGNQALALAVGEPGRQVVITRSLHRSLLLGIMLAGLEPVWVLPEMDPASGLPGPVPVAAVRAALASHPGACAVFLGDPSYVGTTGDLAGHAAVAHEAGVPLIVDAAWAAHLGTGAPPAGPSPRQPGRSFPTWHSLRGRPSFAPTRRVPRTTPSAG